MLKRLLRSALDRLDVALLPFAAATGVLASLYYLLLNPRFRREQRAVLAGRRAFARSLGDSTRSSPLLRRNVHRLEKGLTMQPRAAVFAEDYIAETVEAYLHAAQGRSGEPGELKWARDVLAEYFSAVGDTPRIAAARERFLAGQTAGSPDGEPWRPRARAEGVRSQVDYDAFLALCRQRRSVRWFQNRPVPREMVVRAVDAAAQAPSACNRQPFLFRYCENAADARRVAAIAMGTTGYAGQLPALVVVLGDLSCFPHERDRHVMYIDASLAAMQFMLALETLGLASCPINWPDVESLERRMDAELRLPRHLRPVMLIALGYPDPAGGVPFSAKKPATALLRLDDDYAP